MPTSCPICTAHVSPPNITRCLPTIWSTPTRTASPPWGAAGVPRGCGGAVARRVLYAAREAASAGGCVPQTGRAARDRDRQQSRYLADHIAVDDHEHGGDAVSLDRR